MSGLAHMTTLRVCMQRSIGTGALHDRCASGQCTRSSCFLSRWLRQQAAHLSCFTGTAYSAGARTISRLTASGSAAMRACAGPLARSSCCDLLLVSLLQPHATVSADVSELYRTKRFCSASASARG